MARHFRLSSPFGGYGRFRLCACLRAAELRTLLAADEAGAERAWWRNRFVITMAIAWVLLALTLLSEYVLSSETLVWVFGLATIVVGGAYDLQEAVRAARGGRLAFVQLLLLAVAGAVILGVVEEAAMLLVVYSMGAVLETWISQRARRSLRSLMDLVPASARRRTSVGVQELVAVRKLQLIRTLREIPAPAAE